MKDSLLKCACVALLSASEFCHGEDQHPIDPNVSYHQGNEIKNGQYIPESIGATTEADFTRPSYASNAYFASAQSLADPETGEKKGANAAVGPVFVNYKKAGQDRAAALIELNSGERNVGLTSAVRSERKRSNGVGVITLPMAVDAAHAYSNEIAGADARSSADGHYANAAAGSAFLPRVEYADKVGDETSTPSSITDSSGQKVLRDKHQYRETIWQVTQPIVDVPSIFEYRRLRATEQSSREQLNSTRDRVYQETVSAYLKLIESRLTQKVTDEYEGALKKLLEWTSLRAKAGASSETDADRVRSRVIAARASIAEHQALLETARIQFRRLTGLEPASIGIPESMLPELPPDIETALERAYGGNSDLLSAQSDVEAIQYEQKGKIGRLLPKLEFQYSDHYVYNAGGIAANPQFMDTSPTQRDKRALFVLNFSIFNGGSDINQARALAEKSQEARYRAAEIRRRLEERVLVNFETLMTTRDRISATREEIEVNEKVVTAFNEQLILANRPLLDILDAVQRVNDSKLQLVRMIVAEATASYQLLYNIGSVASEFGKSE